MKRESMRPNGYLLAIGVALTLGVIAPAVRADDNSESEVPDIEELVRIWKEAGERVQTLRAGFRYQKVYGLKENKTAERTGTLWIDGDRWRTQSSGPLWHDAADQFVDTKYIQIFDSSNYLTVFEVDERTDKVHPFAVIYPHSSADLPIAAAEPTSLPWLLSFRNHDPDFSIIKAAEWRSTPEWAVIDGRPCFAVVRRKPSNGADFQFWVCPSLDYRVLRREMDGNSVLVRDQIQYVTSAEFGWLPNAWSETVWIKKTDGSRILEADDKYVIDEITINEPFPDRPFDYKLPEGTWIRDNTQGGKAVARYLVKKGGEKRPITKEELSRINGYTELLNTDSGKAGLPERRPRVNWLFWGSCLILGIAFGAHILQRRT